MCDQYGCNFPCSIGLLVATDSRPKTDLLARELGAKLYTGKKNNNTDIVGMALKALIGAAHGQSSSKALIEELVPTLLGAIQHEVCPQWILTRRTQ